jgi:predicted GNAT superfamily acetyltransferase
VEVSASSTIEELTELEDLRELAELFHAIWERSAEPPINSDLLRALSHSGNYIAGARTGGRLVGGIVGWLGMNHDRELLMHSHILGVLQGSDARGLGFALKQHQRAWCLQRGVRTMEWTFDPLVRRNAYFNLAKLGADVGEYLLDFYGPMHDGINASDESDRILVRWHLDSSKARAAADGHPHDVDAAGLPALVDAATEGEPRINSVPIPATCAIPDDIVAIRRTDRELAGRWRRALRETLGAHVIAGGAVSGITRDGRYVLGHGAN